jgi:lysophospholipase L1-like esterase
MKRIALGLTMILAACAAPSADDAESSEDAVNAAQPRVLALGDSMAFAWDPNIERDPARVDASKYRGYAEMVADRLGAKADNASCPGETSSHFVSATGEDNGCAKNRAAYKLHVDWHDAPDQLAFVESYLAKTKPTLITLSIGGNDLLRVEENCKLPSLLGAGCKLARLPFYEHAYGENLERIIRTIHGAGYRGKMVILTTYAPDYSDAIANFALGRFNGEIRESVAHVRDDVPGMDVRVADGFAAFQARANEYDGKTCKTGLLIANGDGTCDIHPTKEGHQLLAEAILDAIE